MRHAIGIAAALALMGQQGAALAQSRDVGSANSVMPGCRDALSPEAAPDTYRAYVKAECTAIIRTIFFFGQSHFGLCAPNQATVGQAIRVVGVYIDQRPERMHEHFERLALEAMRRAWPCRRQ
jgi:Rap1a immunity proteins